MTATLQQRACRYGSRVRLHNGRMVTVIGFGQECDQPVIDYVDEKGNQFWAWESEVVEVVVL